MRNAFTSTQQEKLRKIRNQMLWNSCAQRMGKNYDEETVRHMREQACLAVTSVTRKTAVQDYKELSLDELQYAIDYVRKATLPDIRRKLYASVRSIGQLHHIAMLCAMEYAVFVPYLDSRGNPRPADDLKAEARAALDGRSIMSDLAQTCLYDWITPTICTMLTQQYDDSDDPIPCPVRRNGKFVQWGKISQKRCTWLITRFNAMYAEITARYNKMQPPNYSVN